jgi:hypothetical protein
MEPRGTDSEIEGEQWTFVHTRETGNKGDWLVSDNDDDWVAPTPPPGFLNSMGPHPHYNQEESDIIFFRSFLKKSIYGS